MRNMDSVVDWSGLLPELLGKIASLLVIIEDFMAFRGVCTSWRDAATKNMFTSVSKLPLLMLSEKDDSDERELYSLSKGKICMRIPIPGAKGFKESEKEKMRIMDSLVDWSGLVPELLGKIASRLVIMEDFMAFSGVCTSWRAAATKDMFVSVSKVPLLMLSEKDDTDEQREFYSLAKGKICTRIPFPGAKGKRCIEMFKKTPLKCSTMKEGRLRALKGSTLNPSAIYIHPCGFSLHSDTCCWDDQDLNPFWLCVSSFE